MGFTHLFSVRSAVNESKTFFPAARKENCLAAETTESKNRDHNYYLILNKNRMKIEPKILFQKITEKTLVCASCSTSILYGCQSERCSNKFVISLPGIHRQSATGQHRQEKQRKPNAESCLHGLC